MAKQLSENNHGATQVPLVREHPKTPPGPIQSLNDAIRQELWYVDTLTAMPFRSFRRMVQNSNAAWIQGLDEAAWALEGMARLPVKFLQSAFGEPTGAKPSQAQSSPPSSRSGQNP